MKQSTFDPHTALDHRHRMIPDPNLPHGYRWATDDEHATYAEGEPGAVLARIYYAPSGNIYTDRTTTALAVLDERNAAIYAESVANRENLPGPRVGDYIRFPNLEKLRRVSYVWQLSDEPRESDRVQTTAGGSFSLHTSGHLSYSGSLYVPVPAGSLTLTDETRPGSAWFFDHGRAMADNAVAVLIPCRIFTCDLEAPSV